MTTYGNLRFAEYSPQTGWIESTTAKGTIALSGLSMAVYRGSGYGVETTNENTLLLYKYDDSWLSGGSDFVGQSIPSPLALGRCGVTVLEDIFFITNYDQDSVAWCIWTTNFKKWNQYGHDGGELGGVFSGSAPAVAAYQGMLYFFLRANQLPAGILFWTPSDAQGTSFSFQEIRNTASSYSSSLCVYRDELYCMAAGNGTFFYNKCTSDGTWQTWINIEGNAGSGAAMAVYDDDILYMVYRDSIAGTVYRKSFDGSTWTDGKPIGSLPTVGDPGLMTFNGKLICSYIDTSKE